MLINITTPVTMILVPTSLNFAPQNVGTSSPPLTATVTNTGSLALTISSVQITGANPGDFSQTNGCVTFPPNGSCNIKVTFTPKAAGVRSAVVTITDNAPNSPQSVRLSGIGEGAAVTLTPSSLSFPSETIGVTSPAQPVTLTVVGGNTALSISSIATQGDFAQTNNCPSSIPVGSGCTINVTFKPTAAGVRNGSLVVTDNATGSPQQVSLTGTGLSGTLGLAVAPGGSSSATVAAGSMATYKLTIGGGGFSGMASLTCTGAPQGANCSFPSGATMNVSATTATPFNVTVTTTARSMAAWSPRSNGFHSWLWAMVLHGLSLLPNCETEETLSLANP